jgi:hypothetical protein
MGTRPNLQATLREFEDSLDGLLDDLLANISEAAPKRFIAVLDDKEDIHRVGNALVIANAVVENDLHEKIDATFADFAWELTRALRALREAAR